MAGIKDYSLTAASNTAINSISIAEGCAPSGINDAIRQEMADTRGFYECGGWIDLGLTHTYSSGTAVTVASDVTASYVAGRRIKAVGSGTGTIYGVVASSSYGAPNTTINFTWDSGSLTNEALTVSAGWVVPTGYPINSTAVKGGGDVSGPASSTDGHIPKFSGTGGKTLADGYALDTDTTLAANSDSNVATQKAVKAYVAAQVAAGSSPDPYPDIGQLYLALARLDTPTSPNTGGTQVADEFDDATGIGSLGSGTVASGYLSNSSASTAVSQAAGTAIGNMTAAGGLAAAFDGTTSQTSSTGASVGATTGYCGKDWGSGVTKSIANIVAYGVSDAGFSGGAGGSSVTITIQGSTDNFSASIVDLGALTFTDTDNATAKTVTATVFTAYRYHRVKIEGTQISTYLGELQFYEVGTPANITTVSNAYTALTAPTTVSFVVEYQDISTTATVNTDIIVSASRNSGTTYTAVTLTDFGPSPISGARVLKGSATVSGQPSGTSIKWKIATANTKEQRVHGIWMQWK